jgi:hypothetical protein
MESNMTTKRYKSILCGLLLLAIAIHPDQHHIEEKQPRIIHMHNFPKSNLSPQPKSTTPQKLKANS